jgi:hypothetical protein
MENTPQEKTPQLKEQKNKGTITGLLVGIIVFLFLAMVGILLFVFTDLGSTLHNQVDVEEGTETGVKDQNEEEDTEVVVLENEGWALYSIPEYGFSVEVPTYSISQELGIEDEQVDSYWEVKQSSEPFFVDFENLWFSSLHDSLVRTVFLSFYPLEIPESIAGGQGYVQEHNITIYILEDDKAFDEIKQDYIKVLQEQDDNEEMGAEYEEVNKWGCDALSFHLIDPGAEMYGYLLSNGEYTYHVSYFFSESPEQSFEIAQKVLDSMKFE